VSSRLELPSGLVVERPLQRMEWFCAEEYRLVVLAPGGAICCAHLQQARRPSPSACPHTVWRSLGSEDTFSGMAWGSMCGPGPPSTDFRRGH
jgi:hypothetical protein